MTPNCNKKFKKVIFAIFLKFLSYRDLSDDLSEAI